MEPVIIYTYAKCDACRKAKRWLVERDIPFEERPVRDRPPSISEFERMSAHLGGQWKRMFNTAGVSYREMDMKRRLPGLSPEAAFALLSGEGNLVKRPFLLGPEIGLVGFKPDEWEATFRAAGAL